MEFDQIISIIKQANTLLFFVFFVTVLFITFSRKNKKNMEVISLSIFDEDELRRIKNE